VKRLFISDCEGPISKNDNAFEITTHFIPDGEKLFTVISKYDDVLAEVLKRPNYKAGDTLKLILPFLKAYDVTNQKMREFSSQNLLLVSGVKETLQYAKTVGHVFIVSTSYEHYLKALCKALNFPYKNTYCTKLDIDKYSITAKEKATLRETAKEIAYMPIIEIPKEATSLKDFPEVDQKIIQQLDEIFWRQIPGMQVGKIFSEVNSVGGSEKAEAIKDAAKKVHAKLSDVMYVGDSITDVEAFKLVRENDGLTVSFNGNRYAIENAEVAVLSEHSIVTAIITDVFCKFGKKHTLEFVENWSWESIKKSSVNHALIEVLSKQYPEVLPKVKIITKENMEVLAEESSEFRKKVRGEAIGRLG